jgi:hypothetical protein
MKLQDFEQRSISLLNSRGILPAKLDAAERFASDFVAYGWLYHSKFQTGKEMLELLEDDSNLNTGDCFNVNFSSNLKNLVADKLMQNTTFAQLLNVLVNNKAKGVGVGELILPLLIAHWRYSNESDGLYRGEKKEIKNNGASLKPVKTGDTEKGLIDQLNAEYFKGLKPGLKKAHGAHVQYIKSLDKKQQVDCYTNYYSRLYPGNDTKPMIQQLLENIEDLDAYNTILGKNVMKWYRNIDGWTSIVIIDPDTLDIVNIADIEKINTDGDVHLSFRPVMSRGSDTQAVPDGYVNVSIVKKLKLNKKLGKKNKCTKLMEYVSLEQRLAEIQKKQVENEAENRFVTFLTDPTDPLTQAWRKVGSDDKIDARDLIVEMIKENRYSNAEIASTVIKSFC